MSKDRKTRAVGDAVDKAIAASPPPEDRLELQVLPGILIHVYLHPDHHEPDDDFAGVSWPGIAACPPDVGDKIVANDQTTIGEVIFRAHRVDPVFGPLLSLAVKVVGE